MSTDAGNSERKQAQRAAQEGDMAEEKGQKSADLLRQALQDLIDEARRETRTRRRHMVLWGTVDVLTGVPAAVLAAISGITGLASTAGRVFAAVLALAAAAFAATTSFLRSNARYVANQRRCRAWMTLEWDARLVYACHIDSEAPALAEALQQLVERRRALMNDDYTVVFSASSGQPASLSPSTKARK